MKVVVLLVLVSFMAGCTLKFEFSTMKQWDRPGEAVPATTK